MKSTLALLLCLCAFSIAVSVPTFVALKNRNDRSIAADTKRIADALERAYPAPVPMGNISPNCIDQLRAEIQGAVWSAY